MSDEERVACRTPTAGRTGQVRIPKWKFEAVRSAILEELASGDVPFSELTGRVKARLKDSERERMGSVGWHVATVKLELEVRGEIGRLSGPGRQVLTLGGER